MILEYLLLLAGHVFLSYGIYTLREARLDSKFHEDNKINGGRKIMTKLGVDVGWINVTCGSFIACASWAVWAIAPPPPSYLATPQAMVLISVLIVISILLSVESQIMKTARQRINEMTPVEHEEVTSITESPNEDDDAASR